MLMILSLKCVTCTHFISLFLFIDLSAEGSQDLVFGASLPHPRGCFPSTPTEDMCRLPVAALLICSGLLEWGHCDGGLQDSMHELQGGFAVGLYRTLTATENSSNLIVSPLSVSASLGLLQLGARGNTLAQLEATLGYNVNGGWR